MRTKKTILAVASCGGHLEQLMIILDGIDENLYLCTTKEKHKMSGYIDCMIVEDCNKSEKLKVIKCLYQMVKIIKSINPDVIISTGAAPGLLAIIIGKIMNKKCIWIDSIANSENLSLSGKIASYCSDICLTQWENLKNNKNVKFWGSIL